MPTEKTKDLVEKVCPHLYDVVGSDTIMFNLGDRVICFNKNEPVKNYKTQLGLGDEVVEYIQKKTAVQVWDLNNFMKQKDVLDKKDKLAKNSISKHEEFCNTYIDSSKSGGKFTVPYSSDGILFKSEDTTTEVTKNAKITKVLSIDNESDVYQKVINPSIYANVSPHFLLLASKGKCVKQPWISLEMAGIDLYKFLYREKGSINKLLYASLMAQSFAAYLYLLYKGYVHGDFKPQNVVVTETDIDHIEYKYNNENINNTSIPTYGRLIKMIDFGTTKIIEDNRQAKDAVLYDIGKFIEVSCQSSIHNDEIDKVLIPLKKYYRETLTQFTTPLKIVSKALTYLVMIHDKLKKEQTERLATEA